LFIKQNCAILLPKNHYLLTFFWHLALRLVTPQPKTLVSFTAKLAKLAEFGCKVCKSQPEHVSGAAAG
jgi:hypothetical protein